MEFIAKITVKATRDEILSTPELAVLIGGEKYSELLVAVDESPDLIIETESDSITAEVISTICGSVNAVRRYLGIFSIGSVKSSLAGLGGIKDNIINNLKISAK